MYLQGYGVIAGFIILSIVFAATMLIISYLIQPKAPSKNKSSTYECGMRPFGDARIQFDVKYYLYAIMFIIFEVEAIFLFPWAIAYNRLSFTILAVEAFIFVFILVIGLIYAWKKGVLKWQ